MAFGSVNVPAPIITVPSRSITVSAAELPAYIAALPRLRTEYLTITVTKGTIPGNLNFNSFYGSGGITINGNGSIANGGIEIYNCSCQIQISSLDVRGFFNVYGKQSAIHIKNSINVSIADTTIDGSYNSGSALLYSR